MYESYDAIDAALLVLAQAIITHEKHSRDERLGARLTVEQAICELNLESKLNERIVYNADAPFDWRAPFVASDDK